MNQQRVFQVAKELGIPNKDLVMKIKSMGIVVTNHMSVLEADDVLRVKRAIERDKQKDVRETWLGDTVFVRKRAKPGETPTAPLLGGDGGAAVAARAESATAVAPAAGGAESEAGISSARLAAEAAFQKVMAKRAEEAAAKAPEAAVRPAEVQAASTAREKAPEAGDTMAAGA